MYNVNIGDDVMLGVIIVRMIVIDEDDGRNFELIYSVESVCIGDYNGSVEDLNKWFGIDSKGEVFVCVKLWCLFMLLFIVNIDVRDDGCVFWYGKIELKVVVKCL